jgi:rubrerythrin
MKEKKVKCRKLHYCDYCEEDIQPGEYAIMYEDRRPKYGVSETHPTWDGPQVGVEFVRGYTHADHGDEDCPECRHRTGFKARGVHPNGQEQWKCSECGYHTSFP